MKTEDLTVKPFFFGFFKPVKQYYTGMKMIDIWYLIDFPEIFSFLKFLLFFFVFLFLFLLACLFFEITQI